MIATTEVTDFSISSDAFGLVQPISVWFRGMRYPGEAVIAENWNASWGEPLDAAAMFRIVLLPRRQAVPPDSLRDERIIVAVSGDNHSDGLPASINNAATQLREVAARYRVAGDAGLDGLTRAVERRTEYLEWEIGLHAREGFLRGRLITGPGAPARAIDIATALCSDHPGDWVGALASIALSRRYQNRPGVPAAAGLGIPETAAVYRWLADGAPPPGRPAAVVTTGLTDEGLPVPELIEAIKNDRSLGIEALRATLVHGMGFPPDTAFLHVAAFVLSQDGEVVWRQSRGTTLPRLIRDNMSEITWHRGMFDDVQELRASVAGDWDSALPYIRLVVPNAEPAERTPVPVQAAEFASALVSLRARSAMASSLFDRVAEVAGQVLSSQDESAQAAESVLAVETWDKFFARARMSFGRVDLLARQFTRMQSRRRLTALALEIEHAVRYLHGAESGLEEGALRMGARILTTRIDLEALTENPGLWPSIAADFSSWRDDYRREYLARHTARRAEDAGLSSEIAVAGNRVQALRWYSQITELGLPAPEALLQRWPVIAALVSPCSLGPGQVRLSSTPFCDECAMRPGVPDDRSDLRRIMSDIQSEIAEFSLRLSRVAIADLLTGQRIAEVERLLNINSVADLNGLSGVLDERIVRFLREYLRGRV
ncbi:MAG: hypothetical protein IIC93_04925 [Chloroflexi bacterium]|nr:hypothetical protein [Chloroflexota bacterium]